MESTAIQHLPEPGTRTCGSKTVLGALSDPVRLSIVRTLAATDGDCRSCGSFGSASASRRPRTTSASCATRASCASTTRAVHRMTELRRSDLDARFPGLLDSIVGAR
jgi:hypothetical protein